MGTFILQPPLHPNWVPSRLDLLEIENTAESARTMSEKPYRNNVPAVRLAVCTGAASRALQKSYSFSKSLEINGRRSIRELETLIRMLDVLPAPSSPSTQYSITTDM